MALALFIIFLFIAIFLKNAAFSLFIGILLSYLKLKYSFQVFHVDGSRYLKLGIILLGGTISFNVLNDIATNYIPIVSIYVLAIMFFGLILGKALKLPKNLNILIVSGTAICGATAIGALSPILGAKKEDLVASVSLVFLLNATAIIIFPYIGAYFNMSNEEFGIFSALTIHDTSSVLGTASLYSDDSVTYASIIKIGRTLWIIPLLIGASIYSKSGNKDYQFPYFILVFLLFIILGNVLEIQSDIKSGLKWLSIIFFQIGLFMIGYKFNLTSVTQIYPLRAIVFATSIWILIITVTLLVFHV